MFSPGHIELFVDNVDVSKAFYTNVLLMPIIQDQGEFVWLEFGKIELLLRKGSVHDSDSYNSSTHALILYTDNLVESKNFLESKGVRFLGTDDNNPKCLTFKDPNGLWFQLVNPNDH